MLRLFSSPACSSSSTTPPPLRGTGTEEKPTPPTTDEIAKWLSLAADIGPNVIRVLEKSRELLEVQIPTQKKESLNMYLFNSKIEHSRDYNLTPTIYKFEFNSDQRDLLVSRIKQDAQNKETITLKHSDVAKGIKELCGIAQPPQIVQNHIDTDLTFLLSAKDALKFTEYCKTRGMSVLTAPPTTPSPRHPHLTVSCILPVKDKKILIEAIQQHNMKPQQDNNSSCVIC